MGGLGMARAAAGRHGRRGVWSVGTSLAQASEPKQDDLLAFKATGQVTLLNFTDLHAQLLPLYFSEPSANIGVGDRTREAAAHRGARNCLTACDVTPGSYDAYALACSDFPALAKRFGRIGGHRPHGHADQGSARRAAGQGAAARRRRHLAGQLHTSLKTRGEGHGGPDERAPGRRHDRALGIHLWCGARAGAGEKARLPLPRGQLKDATWGDQVFESRRRSSSVGGVRIGVIGPGVPLHARFANPRYMIPDWSFGIDEEKVAANVAKLRGAGVDLVVLLSHNGFDVDRKLAARVKGIDVIPDGPYARCAAAAGQDRRHAAGPAAGQPWQVPGAPRPRGARQEDPELCLPADPPSCRCHPARY